MASGIRFNTIFQQVSTSGAFTSLVTFDKVHIVLHHTDGTIALDTTIVFPSDSSQVSVSLNVKLAASAPASGEPMTLDLGYLNAQGQVVFSGTASLTAVPNVGGRVTSTPVTVNVAYTGPGATAKRIVISPRQLAVNTGSPFAYTAVGVDANGTVVPNTPIEWVSLDPTRANISQSTSGVGNALNQRGTARIVATGITGIADTVVLSVLPVAASLNVVSGSGQSGTVGAPTPYTLPQPLIVQVLAADGLGVAGTPVTFGVAGGGGSVSPTSASSDVNGMAQTAWTLGTTVGTQSATATAAGLSGSPATFTATGLSQVATKLLISGGPAAGSNVGAASTIPLTIGVQDASGNPVAGFTGSVSVTLSGGASGATLGGTTTVAAVSGVASFTNLTIATPGTGYVLTATASGLTGASTPAFNIVTGSPTSLVLISGGGQSGAAGATLSPVTVLVTDAAGNARPGATVNFAASNGGSASPISGVTSAAGTISTTWTLGATAGAQTLTVTSAGLPTLTVNATVTSTLNHWVISQQPAATQTAGAAVTPAVVGQLFTPANVLVTSYTGTASLAIGANPGGATLSGTTSVNAVAGSATFTGASLDKVGTGYTLTVNASGTVAAASNAFNVIPGAASTIAIQSGNNQAGQPSTALSAPVVVKVTDANGNLVSGVSVGFAVSAGGGSVGTPTATTNASGLASDTWVLGASGPQTLSITSTGLSGSPLSASASLGAGTLVSTVVSPHFDTLTSISDTYQLAASGRDAANNVVSGTWTWVSRASTVTVNASGLVTAVANGSTYVVATESGGTKDSALVVVQQQIASVNVTPGNRSLYTGGHFSFTAAAVDGRGVAMASQPTFVWSSSQASVASVNAATGVAQAITLGSTQIRATAGTTVGVASLAVITPITRIDVSYDSTNAPAPDVFTMVSLGVQRVYRAVARDTLLNPMSGVTFAWSSTNASVAPIDSFNTLRAYATGAANGTTRIQAIAQGVTGAATLTISQALSSIDLQPTSATVAVTGTTALLARGRDATNHYIPGGTFTYASSAPSIASVNGSSGLVTGVANGTTNITATSASITSNVSVVSVNSSGAALITFSRDTIAIGRGGTLSVPILLSKPSASNVKVNLTVGDTSAFWSTASVTIPAGQTAVNAQLNGHNAGTTIITALDGSGTGYGGDTAVLAVQASVRLANGSYGLNATDQLATQVLLSDPSPVGGTFVTYTYSTAGKASLSPDPAFIPAGQLASNVVLTGLAAGNTTITPTATGVSGTASFVNVSPATLSAAYGTLQLGVGQNFQNAYVLVAQYMNTPLNVTLTSSDTTIVTTSPRSVTIQSTGYFAYFNVYSVGVGTATITMSAPGWTSATMTVVNTTPRVTVCCGNNLTTTSGTTSINAYSADSSRNIHTRTSSLAVRVASSDSTVIRVIDTLVTIAANTYNVSARVIPGGSPGTAWVKVSASGHSPADSVQFTVAGPSLYLSYGYTGRIGAGQSDQWYLQIPNAISTPVVVTLANSDTTKATAPATVTIPAGQTYLYFTVQGLVPGVSILTATAPGYSQTTSTVTVTTPKIAFAGNGNLNNFSQTSFNVYTRDTVGYTHNRIAPLTVRLRSTDSTVFTVDTIGTIPTGSSSVPGGLGIFAVGPGTAQIIVTAPGHFPDTVSWTVLPAKLRLSWKNYTIGARQHRLPTDFSVSMPSNRSAPVTVTLTQKNPSAVSVTATSLTIPVNSNYQYFGFGGLTPGVDTIIATAPGYLPDTGYVRVTTPHLFVYGVPGTATTTNPPYTTTLYTADSVGGFHYASDTVVVHAVSSDTAVLVPGQPYFRILKNAYYSNPTIIYTGPGTASITYSDSANSGYLPTTTNTVTVTGPSLSISGGNNGMLGMRQQSSPNAYYVYVPNNVGTPLTVNLVSTDPRVVTVPASVIIAPNTNYAYFTITAQDTIGTIQVQATATGYAGTNVNMQVTAPQFLINTYNQLNTTSPSTNVNVYTADALGNPHYTTQNVTVTLASSATGVATIDSQTVTIAQGSYYNNNAKWSPGAAGTAQFSATDTRAAYYRYNAGTVNVSVIIPTAQLSFYNYSLGIGQYTTQYVQIPNTTSNGLTVPLSHSAVARTTTPSSVAIPANSTSQTFTITGTSVGSDTITASPPGHNPASGVVSVGVGRIDPLAGWPTVSLKAGDSTLVTLYARDPNQGTQYVAAATTFTLSPNANVQFVSGGSTSTVITSVTIAAGTQYVQFYLKGVTAGAGTASITSSNYTTYTNSVTVTP